jgi:DNA-binding transcriptional LysR family regulator
MARRSATLNFRQIETFYWAATLGSFVKAARHLNATQSAVSMRIQELESRLGLVLFDRSQRTATLTSQGRQLFPLAERFLENAAAIAGLSGAPAEIAGHVRLAVAEVVAMTWLPDFIKTVQQRFPKVQIEVQVALSYVIEERILHGAVDMAFAPCELSRTDFTHTSLGAPIFRWMCAPGLKSAPESISAQELADHPVIITSRETQFRGSTRDWIGRNLVRFVRPTICNTFTIAGRMAIAGLGIAFLPVDCYRDALARGELRVVHCTPEVEPLEHFVVRPANREDVVQAALESVGVKCSTFIQFPEAGDPGGSAQTFCSRDEELSKIS